MKSFLEDIRRRRKAFAVLIDPDKTEPEILPRLLPQLPDEVSHIFIGGSRVASGRTRSCIRELRLLTELPLVIFPGDHEQISEEADTLLFLSLLSGRNPEYLIGQHLRAAQKLRNSSLEIIPTAYILIDGGRTSAVEQVSGTLPLPQNEKELISDTALAGKLLGKQLVYLEAGSGAVNPVSGEIIRAVKKAVDLPVIVGGGIRSSSQCRTAWQAGADVVVVGTAFEGEQTGWGSAFSFEAAHFESQG